MKAILKYLFLFQIIVGLSLGYYFFNKNKAQRSGSLNLTILEQDVQVSYDEWAIPHLEAKTTKDAFRALGFIIAQERLFQMEMQRRLSQGKLSELVGDAALQIDKNFRELGFKHYSQIHLNQMLNDPKAKETLELAQAYLDGVNYYLNSNKRPIEFYLLNIPIQNFELIDMITFGAYMAYSFEEAIDVDTLLHQLNTSLSPDKLKQLKQVYPQSESHILEVSTKNSELKNKENKNIVQNSNQKIKLNPSYAQIWQQIEDFGFMRLQGSNSWVLSPNKSASGKAILANDPHIGFSNPSVWYEAHIKSPDLEIYGHFLPIVSFPVLGQTKNHAWAITMSEVDDLDLMERKRSTENPNIIQSEGQWIQTNLRKEVIKIKSKPDYTMNVEDGKYGPILNEILQSEEQYPIELKWTYYLKENRLIQMFHQMATAQSVHDFSSALELATSPGLNISYADKQDNIAWWVIGKIPVRHQGHDGNGVLSAYNISSDYKSYLNFKDNPHSINPSSGYIITANNSVSNLPQHNFHGYYQDSNRSGRIVELITGRNPNDKSIDQYTQMKKFNVEDLKLIITDPKATYWTYEKEFLSSHLDIALKEQFHNYYSEWENWNGHNTIDSIGASIYQVWLVQLMLAASQDEIGQDNYNKFYSTSRYSHLLFHLLRDSKSSWWDNVNTEDKVETANEIINQSFVKTIEYLRAQLGSDKTKWQWGQLHQLELIHPIGRQKYLSKIFNLGPEAVPGSRASVNANAQRKFDKLYNVISGPSTRRIIDFANPNYSWGINPSGQSGNVFDHHHSDQWPLFISDQFRKQYLDLKSIPQNKIKKLTLKAG